MPYSIKDLDDRSVFLCACLLNAQENGGNLHLSEVITSLKVNKSWASIFLREAKKLTLARISGAGDDAGAADGQGGEAVDEASKDAKKTKRKAVDNDEEGNGTDKQKKAPKVRKIRAKKVAEGAGEVNGDGDDGLGGGSEAV